MVFTQSHKGLHNLSLKSLIILSKGKFENLTTQEILKWPPTKIIILTLLSLLCTFALFKLMLLFIDWVFILKSHSSWIKFHFETTKNIMKVKYYFMNKVCFIKGLMSETFGKFLHLTFTDLKTFVLWMFWMSQDYRDQTTSVVIFTHA